MKYWDLETIKKIREGYYSAVYFNRTKKILLEEKNLKTVTMQIFQKKDNTIICGVDTVAALLKEATGYFDGNNWIDKHEDISLFSLRDGEVASSLETAMHIQGPYAYFAHLESLYLGILARQSKIATNSSAVVRAANGKPVLFFADRFDYFLNQEIDGYAAKIGGVTGVATAAQANFWNGSRPTGTIPHALIAVHNGNTLEAAKAFSKNFPDTPLIVLVDFENDCVKTSLEIAKHFGNKLYGVRLDTSENMIDKSLQLSLRGDEVDEAISEKRSPRFARDDIHGVNPQLVTNVRNALNVEGFEKVKIIVSGGFNKEKIEQFERENVPVDIYGVGSSLMIGGIDFTADIVEVNGKKIAKVGRELRPNKRLQVIDMK